MSIPVTQAEIYRRCKIAMADCGKGLNAIDTGVGYAIFWESDLKPGGKVRRVECLEPLARQLGVMSEIEPRGGDWAARWSMTG